MDKTKGIILFNCLLDTLKESEYINSSFSEFLSECMRDYMHNKKLKYSLESLFEFRKDLIDEEVIII